MVPPIKYKLNEKIVTKSGKVLDLMYIGEVESKSKNRKVRVVCTKCGQESVRSSGQIQAGFNCRCVYSPKEGNYIKDLHGVDTDLIMVSYANSYGTLRKVNVKCVCGKVYETRLSRIRQRKCLSCGCLRNKAFSERRKCSWIPGDIVGHFKILEYVGMNAQGKSQFVVENLETKEIKTFSQNHIQRFGYRRVERLVRARVSKAISNGYTKRSYAYKLLGADFETVMNYLGEKPQGGYHLDHICPLQQAKTDEEIVKLSHYTNLQWLKSEENLSKRNAMTDEGINLCKKLLNREPK